MQGIAYVATGVVNIGSLPKSTLAGLTVFTRVLHGLRNNTDCQCVPVSRPEGAGVEQECTQECKLSVVGGRDAVIPRDHGVQGVLGTTVY